MKLETLGRVGPDYAPCQYGMSRLIFRGPRKSLDGDYVACIGGSETFGRFLRMPFVEQLEQGLGQECVNLGCVNAGMDAFLRDGAVMAMCHDARAVVVQIMGAQNQNNNFYKVHPRRNDRFLRPTEALMTLYPDVDFADFTFTRHMLAALQATDPDRFSIVHKDLQFQWSHSMRRFVQGVDCPVVLLWMADHGPSDGSDHNILRTDPLFVTRAMVDEVAQIAAGYVDIVPTEVEIAEGARGMVYGPAEAYAAAQALGQVAHEQATEALQAVLKIAVL
jgi:hypothetical protein